MISEPVKKVKYSEDAPIVLKKQLPQKTETFPSKSSS